LIACADERGLSRLVEYYNTYGFTSEQYNETYSHVKMRVLKTQLIQKCSMATGGNRRVIRLALQINSH